MMSTTDIALARPTSVSAKAVWKIDITTDSVLVPGPPSVMMKNWLKARNEPTTEMRVYVEVSVPRELIDAARLDGAGELRIFFRLALPLMVPGLMTVLLLSIVGVWNNYFLPLIIFSQNRLYPLTVGLGLWAQRAQNSGNAELFPLVVIGGLITIIPLIALFLVLQRYWRSGLLLGSIAN
jgi:ABC-type glycerol-3-phosphate transport system permease component